MYQQTGMLLNLTIGVHENLPFNAIQATLYALRYCFDPRQIAYRRTIVGDQHVHLVCAAPRTDQCNNIDRNKRYKWNVQLVQTVVHLGQRQYKQRMRSIVRCCEALLLAIATGL
jgi:hypothetical protein